MSKSTSVPTVTIGIISAITASFAFSFNDMGIKFLSGDYPLHEIVLFRASIGLLFTMAIFLPIEGGYSNLKTKRLAMHLLRGLLVVTANMTFFLGLAAMPLSEASAIFFVAPLMITLFSVIFLKEQVGLYRWLAVIAGLVGVIIMFRPGAATFQWAALFPFFAAVCYAGMHMMTRKMGVTEKASTLAFYIQLTFVLVSLTVGLAVGDGRYAGTGDPSIDFLLRAWIWPTSQDFWIIIGLGIASSVGGYLISQAYRTCEAAIIAPFEYVSLIMSIILGMIVFSEYPDAQAWFGICLIFGSGLLVFWREAVLKKRIATERPMPRQR
jgi:drug/metabolite transporter (DMT)-like permease